MQACACFEHSNFFKVNVLAPQCQASPKAGPRHGSPRGKVRPDKQYASPKRWTARSNPKFDYELFNCSNLNIRYWSWNYRGCWHQTCPPLVPRERYLNCTHSNCKIRKDPALLFIVTTSLCQDWVICAPAAFLGCSSRFSGSFSGIEP